MTRQLVLRDDVTRYFLDTEFIENGTTIDLVSIGLVTSDGREYYAASEEADLTQADAWFREHVMPSLPPKGPLWKPRVQIRSEILSFVKRHEHPFEFWAYYADYDWVALCQLFGRMIDLPMGWPKYCMDIKQLAQLCGQPELPRQATGMHNALADARWNRAAFAFLQAL